MPRPQRYRRICHEPEYKMFSPDDGISSSQSIIITTDEFETIRLVDYEKMTHEQAAAQMDISRTTVTEIYESARFKISDSIVNGKPLIISGGRYKLCDGSLDGSCRKSCRRPNNTETQIITKGRDTMRIAATYENGQIFQHFGHTEKFKIYDVEDGKIKER